jgi:phosphoribosylaminoimidazole-succinocarboxamide synthase
MNKLFEGKTKDVYVLDDGNYLLKFKDDATVDENGQLDPGGNKIGLSIQGLGLCDLRLTDYFYQKIQAAGIPTHMISTDVDNVCMTVRPAVMFGKGLEVICRFRATGSFVRRYGAYVDQGRPLDALVEFGIKDDQGGDPFITQDTLECLGILQPGEYDTLTKLTRQIAAIVKDELAAKGMEMYDIKLEFGKAQDGAIMLADEISAGSLRAYLGDAPVKPLELARILLEG